MSDLTLKCFRCGKTYPVTDMRYVSTNTMNMICKFCLNKGTQAETKPKAMPISRETPAKTMPSTAKKPSTAKDEHVEYACHHCSYTFKRKKSAEITSCPYCASKDIEIKTGKSSQDLISESMGKQFDM